MVKVIGLFILILLGFFIVKKTLTILNKSLGLKKDIDGEVYKYIIECSQALEKYIEEKLNGSGKGLHEKVSSVENKFSKDDVKKIRFIASVRNQVIHEAKMTCDIDDIKRTFEELNLKYNIR